MIVYTEHPKESIKKLLELVTVMWDHKMKDHILKLILLLDTNSLLVFELRFKWKLKKTTIHNSTKNTHKSLDRNLTKYLEDFHG